MLDADQLKMIKSIQNGDVPSGKDGTNFYNSSRILRELIKQRYVVISESTFDPYYESIVPTGFSLSESGRHELQLKSDKSVNNVKNSLVYPIFVNFFCGIGGFILGWFVNNYLHTR